MVAVQLPIPLVDFFNNKIQRFKSKPDALLWNCAGWLGSNPSKQNCCVYQVKTLCFFWRKWGLVVFCLELFMIKITSMLRDIEHYRLTERHMVNAIGLAVGIQPLELTYQTNKRPTTTFEFAIYQ